MNRDIVNECARICENMIVGGRAWTEEQEIAAGALQAAANNMRKFVKPGHVLNVKFGLGDHAYILDSGPTSEECQRCNGQGEYPTQARSGLLKVCEFCRGSCTTPLVPEWEVLAVDVVVITIGVDRIEYSLAVLDGSAKIYLRTEENVYDTRDVAVRHLP